MQSTVLAILAILFGGAGVGGGVKVVAMLTRLVVAAEQAGPAISALGDGLTKVGGTLQSHEVRLAVQQATIAQHDAQLAALAAPAAPAVPASPTGNVT